MDLITIFIATIVGIICFTVPKFILSNYNIKSTYVSYIPTFCTSIGVFFSFGVLWIVLSNFNLGNDLGSIVRLLAGKFLFSIIGIASSIGWSMYIRYKLTQEESIESQRIYMTKDPQELLWELVGLQEESNRFSEEFTRVQYRTVATLENIGDRIREGSSKVTSAIYESNQLQLQKLQNLLEVMTTAGEYMREQLGTMIQDMKESLEDYIQTIGDQVLNLTQEQAILINNEFVRLVTNLQENMTSELSQSRELAERIIKTFEGSITEKTKEAIAQQKTMMDDFKTTSETQINNLKESYSNLEETLGTIDTNIQEEINRILTQNVKNLHETFKKLEEIQQRAQTALEKSSQAFKDAVDEYKNVQNTNAKVTEQMEAQLTNLDDLLENTRQLYEKWSLQDEEIKQMQDRTNAIANMTDEIDRLLKTLQQSTNHK